MDSNVRRWIKRRTMEGREIIYDTFTRNVYLNGAEPELHANHDLFSLPTFDPRAPLKVYFDFTYLCNLECRHCITNSSPRVNIENEMSSERIASLMDELATLGVLEIGVGGGEPLCHTDLFQLLDHAKKTGLNVLLTTNGILVTPEAARRLNQVGVFEVRVSFDGSEAVHNNIRGAGTYRKALKAVRVLVDSGVKAVPRITICNDEKAGLDTLVKDLAETGATSAKAAFVFPRGRATLKENLGLFKYKRDSDIARNLLDLAKVHALDLKIAADMAVSSSLADGKDLRSGKRKSCGAGFQTAYISPHGNVQPCSGMPDRVFGNLKSGSFISSWTGDNAENWRQFTSTHDSWFLCGHENSYGC